MANQTWSKAGSEGFVLMRPPGWSVRVSGAGDLAIEDPGATMKALVRRRAATLTCDLESWLIEHIGRDDPELENAHLVTACALGPQVAHAAFDVGRPVLLGRSSVVAMRHRATVTVFVAMAPRDTFVEALPMLTRILESARVGRRSALHMTDDAWPRATVPLAQWLRHDAGMPRPRATAPRVPMFEPSMMHGV